MPADAQLDGAQTTAELVRFARQYPTRPLDDQSLVWMIETLGLERDCLLDVADEAGRRLVATLFADWDNPQDAAEVWIVGYRPGPGGPAALEQALRWAEAKAKASGASGMEISLPPALLETEAAVKGAGYELAYQLLTMDLGDLPNSEALGIEPPSRCTWTALDEQNVSTALDCYARAFATTSGAQVPSLEMFKATMLHAENLPRVLLDGDRALGYARVVWLDEAARLGEVRIIARHPDAPDPGLGKATLAEALRQLAAMGATRACLEVASDNDRAVGLYRRFGFTTREQASVYRRRLESVIP